MSGPDSLPQSIRRLDGIAIPFPIASSLFQKTVDLLAQRLGSERADVFGERVRTSRARISPLPVNKVRCHRTRRVDDVAPFGLAVLTALAEFAAVDSVPWIMDY
ncbi:MAG: hypothetical protein ACXV8R_16645 [Acidimicrobiia bacterium]